MIAARKKNKKRSLKCKLISDEARVISVVAVRFTDEEKERIDLIMRDLEIKHYSDIMRLAFQTMKLQYLSV